MQLRLKIKSIVNLESVLLAIIFLYIVIIAYHYYSYQSSITSYKQENSVLTIKLHGLQESSIQGHSDIKFAEFEQFYQQNYLFIDLLEVIKKNLLKNLIYKKITKKNYNERIEKTRPS